MGLNNINIDPKDMAHIEAIILSMTKKERQNPDIINGSRRKRIASGSGTSIQDVNRVIKNYEQSKKMMKQFAGMEKDMKKGKMKMPFFR